MGVAEAGLADHALRTSTNEALPDRPEVAASRAIPVRGGPNCYVHERRPCALDVIGKGHIYATIRDRNLRKALTPTYATGCKRIMIANGYYSSVAQENVMLVPSGIREVTSDSIVAHDGSEHQADVIIWATGFRVIDPPFLNCITGVDGQTLAQVWKDQPRAYMGASVTGFPNAFMMWGPNVGTGCNFVMVQAQLNYVLKTLEIMRQNGAGALDIRSDVVDVWKSEMTQRLLGSTWVNGGCRSWYQDGTGDIHAIYGGFMTELLRRSRKVDVSMFTQGAFPQPDLSTGKTTTGSNR